MKVLVVGATGTIGSAVADLLAQEHDVIRVGNKRGDIQVDLASKASIAAMYEKVGKVDAVVSAAGVAAFAPAMAPDDAAYDVSLDNKLMGQVNLVRLGSDYVADGGSFTLTAGALSQVAMPGTAPVAMANAALEAFGRSGSLDLGRDQRVNVVSPGFIAETMVQMGMDPTPGMPAAAAARAYKASVEGGTTGATIDPVDHA